MTVSARLPFSAPTIRSAAELQARHEALGDEFGEEITLDGLAGNFRIFQRRRGHRYSTDDLLTAWYAMTSVATPPTTMLDLGTGIGSVGLSLAWFFPEATLTAIEVQDVSYRLFTENVWANDLESRVRTIHGDLRETTSGGEGRSAGAPLDHFDLVSGSPPYFDVKDGIVSADSQRAGARFELRGDVRDYCLAARRTMGPEGCFIFCLPTLQRAKAERACAEANLIVTRTCDVIPRATRSALFSLYACKRADNLDAVAAIFIDTFTVRDVDGAHTKEMTEARKLLGLVD